MGSTSTNSAEITYSDSEALRRAFSFRAAARALAESGGLSMDSMWILIEKIHKNEQII